MVVSNDIEDYINDVKVYLEHNLFHTSYYYVQGEDFLKDVDHFYHPVSNVEVDHEVHDVGNDKDFNCIQNCNYPFLLGKVCINSNIYMFDTNISNQDRTLDIEVLPIVLENKGMIAIKQIV